VAVERESQRAQVVIVENASTPQAVAGLAASLTDALGAELHSLWWNGQPARSNAILGPHWRRLSGPVAIREPAAGHSVFHPPGAFGQSHPSLFDRLAARLRAHVPADCVATELYAGVGTLGLPLLPRVRELRLIEVNPHGVAGLVMGAAAMPRALHARLRLGAGAASDHLDLLEGADVVIVDPPRRGLDPELLAELVARPPRLLLYVSCRPARLALEADALAQAGLLPTAFEPFDLFPYGEHVELLAAFERR
jgi:tRNA/tmRNA/rRNA uracil-C5-methylase (TrmA/RlmC/RlmD family)